MTLSIPELSLVILIGASGSGKSTFARAHFKPTEVVASDACRAMVSDDENDMAATDDAFKLLHYIVAMRLAAGRLTVVDATNVQPESRKPLVALARKYHCLPVAIVFDMPARVCVERNRARADRAIPQGAIHRQLAHLRKSIGALEREGFRYDYRFRSAEDVNAAVVERKRAWTDLSDQRGPFDVIGDVHGCYDELVALLGRLGYAAPAESGVTDPAAVLRHRDGRRAIFLGDLVDRGPNTPDVLRLVMGMVDAGAALCVPGNHDMKLLRVLNGRKAALTHGLAETMAQLGAQPPEFIARVRAFLAKLVSHYVVDDRRLIVAHAGMKAEMQGRASRVVRDFALYGETTGEVDTFGLPVRLNWAEEYRGPAMVAYGHTPVAEPRWLNRTINIDTGCVFGGHLTALRYPERELVSVPAARVYYAPERPLVDGSAPAVAARDYLDIDDVLGRRDIETRLGPRVIVRGEQASTALEIMTRFAIDPRWLIYLPPTMSPSETSQRPGLLEHPEDAIAYYAAAGVTEIVCEEKHMGSRAILVLCRTPADAGERFGVTDGAVGACFTRTGRRFFNDTAMETALLDRVRGAMTASGVWDDLGTAWVCLDAEITPWSLKAESLIRSEYAATAAAATAGLSASRRALEEALAGGRGVDELLQRTRARLAAAERYGQAYRRYVWPVRSIADVRVAIFHVLAGDGAVHVHRPHAWHLAVAQRLCDADVERYAAAPVLQPTAYRQVAVADVTAVQDVALWWEALTSRGGEGVVVKPAAFLARGARGIVQPALKCRGPEYLRIIYGPEYDLPENLDRLRRRRLSTKRSLAVQEFALGLEALYRFVDGDPLHRVHECVFGVLALESEPVDPRL